MPEGISLLDQPLTAADMRRFVEALSGPHVSERSTKLWPGRQSTDRFLVTCQPEVLGSDPRRRFRDIALALGCDPSATDRLLASWDRVITVHLGCDGIDPPLFKLYVEYELGRSGRSDIPDDTIFLSAKWRPGREANFSRYRHLSHPTNGVEARDALRRNFAGDVGEASAAFTDRVLSELITPEGRVDVMLVEDEDTPRKSFDINLYRVDTPLARHRRALEELCAAFGLPAAAPAILADGQGTMLGHVAIGRDAAGTEFVTLYYAATKHDHR
ncbi:MAG TPA: hypothetical protein VGV07_20165 [Devosia sp.]|jgi:hypothetical protein|uniref:hypothetical protein n=1 Tax=Devosia sp. TaxID=1871048 RepID=UPI002DDD1765|nr:hypothetical protein [Devosia sp.]HEV2517581.1 hypothetical protein [Devosia sp.]